MSSAENSIRPNVLRRVSTPIFLLLALLLIPAGTFVSLTVGILVCVIAGIESTDLQARIGLAALLIGFVGSIYLTVRARRPPSLRQANITANQPPPLTASRATQSHAPQSDDLPETSRYEAAGLVSEEVEDSIDQTSVGSTRIVDWLKVATTPVLIAFNASLVFVALSTMLSPIWTTVGFAVVPIAFVSALTFHLMGTHFDPVRDRLSYPYLAWRLRLPLSGIQDANAQTISKRGVDVLASLGEKNPKHKTVHHYHVNLSGDFGARRLMFRSKFKRDQFLSILRALRPDVRITRWS
jgi:hypothetical protein